MKRISMAVAVVLMAAAALGSLAPWPVQKEYYGVLAHWRMNDNQVAGAVAQYKLDDEAASTTVVNAKGGANATWGHGNTDAHDAAAWCTSFGQSLEFDGTNDYINTGQTFQTTFRSSFSISMWVQPHDGRPANYQSLLGADEVNYDSNMLWVLLCADGRLQVTYGEDDPNNGFAYAVTTDPVFSDGEQNWHNIVIVFTEGEAIEIFMDGVAVALDPDYAGDLTNQNMNSFTSTSEMCFGCWNYNGQQPQDFFDGRMDNIAIYPRALTAQDVAFIASCGTQDTESDAFTVAGSDPDGRNLTSQTSLSNIASESGQIGRSFAFDGTNDYLSMADDSDLDFNGSQDFSISVWIKRPSADAAKYIVSKKSGAGYVLFTTSGYNGGLGFVRYGPGGTNYEDTYTTGVDVQDDAWHHVVAVRTHGAAAKIFVDGVDCTYATGNDAESYDLQTAGDFHVGCTNSHSYLWDGSLDDLIIFNRALTAAEVDALYDRGTQTGYARELSSPLYDWRFLEDLRFTEYMGTVHPYQNTGAMDYPVVADYQSGGRLDDYSPTTAKSLLLQYNGEVYMNNATITLPLSANYDPSASQSWTKMCNPNNYRHFDRGSDRYYLDADGDFVLGYTVLPTQVDPYAQSYGVQKYGGVALNSQPVAITGEIISEYFDGMSRIAASTESIVTSGGVNAVEVEIASIVTAPFVAAFEELEGHAYATVCGYENVNSELFGCNGSMLELILNTKGPSAFHWELVETHTDDPNDPDYYAFHPRYKDGDGEWVNWVESANGQTVDGHIQAFWRRVPLTKHLDWSHTGSVKMWPGSNDEGKLPPGIEENKSNGFRDRYIRCAVDSNGDPLPNTPVSGTNSLTLADVKHIYEEHAFGKMSGGNWVPGAAPVHVKSGSVAYSSIESDTSLSGTALSSNSEQQYVIGTCALITSGDLDLGLGFLMHRSEFPFLNDYERVGWFANDGQDPLGAYDLPPEEVWASTVTISDWMERKRQLNPWISEAFDYRWNEPWFPGICFGHTFEIANFYPNHYSTTMIDTGDSYASLTFIGNGEGYLPVPIGGPSFMQRIDPYARKAGYALVGVVGVGTPVITYKLVELVIETGPAWLAVPTEGFLTLVAYGVPSAVVVGGLSYGEMVVQQQVVDLLDIFDNGEKVIAIHGAPLVTVDLRDDGTMAMYGDALTGGLSKSKLESTRSCPAVIWTTKPHFHLYEWEEEMDVSRFGADIDLRKTGMLKLDLFPVMPTPQWPAPNPNNIPPVTSGEPDYQHSNNQDRAGSESGEPVYPQRLVNSPYGGQVDTGVGIAMPYQTQEPDYDELNEWILEGY